jgi:uncharacterized membrane protein YheB (UPF0754 family)
MLQALLQKMLQELLHQMLQGLLQEMLQELLHQLLQGLLQGMLQEMLQGLLHQMLQEMLQDLLQEMPGVCVVISMQELMLVQEEMQLNLLYKEIRSFLMLVQLDSYDVHVPEMFKIIL